MNSRVIGGGLIALGLFMILLKFFHFSADLTLFFIGGCFLAAYFGASGSKRNKIGFLIPGCILMGLGTATILNQVSFLNALDDVLFFVCLGAAFAAIRIVGDLNGSKVGWAAIVAFALFAFATFLFVVKYASIAGFLGSYLWPILFICVGLAIILGNLGVKLFRKRG